MTIALNESRSSDRRKDIGLRLNIASLILLSLLAIGLFTMPRFNYEQLIAQQAEVSNRQRTLEDKFHDLNILKGDDEKKKYAVLQTLGQIPELLDSLHQEYSRFIGVFDALKNHEERIKSLEDRVSAGLNEPLTQPKPVEASFNYLEPIEVGAELKAKADHISAKGLYGGQFEDFIGKCLADKLMPFETQEEIPPEAIETLARYFSTFKLAIMWTDYKERVSIQELVKTCIERGDYTEVPIENSGESLNIPGLTEPGYMHVKKYKELGVKTYFPRVPF